MTKKVKPIRPDQVLNKKKQDIPDEVLEVFNQLIAKIDGDSITIRQDDVIALLEEKGLKRAEIFDKQWLDVEDIYEEAGWKVEYDKPGYNESYPPIFTFRRPLKK